MRKVIHRNTRSDRMIDMKIVLSMISVSLVKRVMIRPTGFESKNAVGARSTPHTICLWKFNDIRFV